MEGGEKKERLTIPRATEQFIDFYYNTFDADRRNLGSLYVRAHPLPHPLQPVAGPRRFVPFRPGAPRARRARSTGEPARVVFVDFFPPRERYMFADAWYQNRGTSPS